MQSSARKLAPKLKGLETARIDPIVKDVLRLVRDSDMSLEEIERKSGVSGQTIWRWSKGSPPNMLLAIALVQALDHNLEITK